MKGTCLITALLILLGYALVLYFFDDYSKMGIIISISVVCMDVFNLILYASKQVSNASSIIVLFIINRVLMVILGASYWAYGFMGLYVLYALALLYQVAKNTFPLANQTVNRYIVDLKDAKTQRQQIQAYVKGANPFYLILILTVLYFIFMIII